MVKRITNSLMIWGLPALMVMAQGSVQGRVVHEKTGKPLLGVNLTLNEINGHRSSTIVNMGVAAVRLGRILHFDPVKQEFINDEGANRLIYPEMRSPWNI